MFTENINSDPSKVDDPNHQVWSFVIATNKALKISSGEEAIQVLLWIFIYGLVIDEKY